MNRKFNLFIIVATLILYFINQTIKQTISNQYLRWFACCYFNDIIGSMTFLAYCNIIFSYRNLKFNSFWQVLLMILLCGFVWEVITPIFRANTVGDVWDILAYSFGATLYWLIIAKKS